MVNPRVEFAISLLFIGLVIGGLYLTSQIDLAFSSDLETFSGPRAYPGIILSVMLLLFAGTAAMQIRDVLGKVNTNLEYEGLFGERARWSLALFVALLCFVLLFESVGYILTMVPLLAVVSLLCGAPNKLGALVVAICLSTICLVIFRYGLSTVLPEGWFGIDAVL